MRAVLEGFRVQDQTPYGFSHLVGIPFLDGGRDPASGLDCWGLFMAANKVFGIDVPDFHLGCQNTVQIYLASIGDIRSCWSPVTTPHVGDAVVMALDPDYPECIQHFGVMIETRRFLHTLEKTGAIVSGIDHPFFKNRIKGYYRFDSDNGR
jgi:cell wall-associated NlpC family hydrolase